MITNVRARLLHDKVKVFPDNGKILHLDSALNLYVPQSAVPSTHGFFASDFTLKDQMNLGMDLKPTFIKDSNIEAVNNLSHLLSSLSADEFANMQAASLESENYDTSSPSNSD